MKTPIAALAFATAALCAGSTLAQTRSQTPAPRPGATPPPAVGSVPAGQSQGQTVRSTGGEGGPDGGSVRCVPVTCGYGGWGDGRLTADGGSSPVNGIGGTGGGRYTFNNGNRGANAETGGTPDAPAPGHPAGPTNGIGGIGGGRLAPGAGDPPPVAAEAIISTTRSNIKKPSALADGATPVAPATPAPIPPS